MSKHTYKENYDRIRFHIQFGPDILFERVRFRMKDVHKLYLEGEHFQKRLAERGISGQVLEKLLCFDIAEWKLKTAEVRKDRGKFVNSTWEKVIDGVPYWVTIGMGQYVKTIVIKTTSGVDKCVRGGDFYDFVREVNQKLMDNDMETKKPET